MTINQNNDMIFNGMCSWNSGLIHSEQLISTKFVDQYIYDPAMSCLDQ